MTTDPPPLASCRSSFGQHHGYPPRQGWLKKVHTELSKNPHLFDNPEPATVTLGVGSSMVLSLRFWAEAFGLITRSPTDRRALTPTRRGRWLLDEETGADPWLEYPASLWLLHWWLLSNRVCAVPSWYYLFSESPFGRYTRIELRTHIQRAAQRTGWAAPGERAVARDIACMATMYAPQVGSVDQPRAGIEDVLLHPFRDLNLLSTAAPEAHRRDDRSHKITINRGAGRAAPSTVLLYACLDYAARNTAAPGSIALTRLASGPGSPGRIMLLDGGGLRRALEREASRRPPVAVMETGDGECVLAYEQPPALLADQVLADAFNLQDGPGEF